MSLKRLKLIHSAHRVCFYATITEIFYISGESQLAGDALSKISIADALHSSRNVKPLGL